MLPFLTPAERERLRRQYEERQAAARATMSPPLSTADRARLEEARAAMQALRRESAGKPSPIFGIDGDRGPLTWPEAASRLGMNLRRLPAEATFYLRLAQAAADEGKFEAAKAAITRAGIAEIAADALRLPCITEAPTDERILQSEGPFVAGCRVLAEVRSYEDFGE